jgi:N-acetylglucosaminyldiphosphoundecaprenol N-acetyl-beta-D-mannosaminyltransferase
LNLGYEDPELRRSGNGADVVFCDGAEVMLASSENEAVVQEINGARPDILLVGMGMPLQEYWLIENRDGLEVSVVLTGGAVLDYVPRGLRPGPRVLTDNGFEWLARLLVEPRRLWRRYLFGTPLFLLRVLR